MGAAPILTILKDGETVRSVPIEGEALLGREEGCVIRLEDRMISRQHALFRRKGDQIQVEKKSEFAPLLVNGTDCTQAVLKDGDVIAIGPYLMKLSLEKQQQAESPAPDAQPFKLDAPVLELGSSGEADLPELHAPLEAAPTLAPAPASDILSLEPDDSAAETPDLLAPVDDDQVGVPQAALSLDPPEPTAGEDRTRVIAANSPQFRLIFKPGDADVLDYQMQKDEISIGRGKDCDIVLTDKKVSRKNTLLYRSGNVVSIKDLGSSNGTFVNGQKVTEVVLAGGDRIKIGEAEIEFRADQPGYSEQEKDFLAVAPVTENSGPVELPPFQMDGGGMPMLAPSDGLADSNPMTPMISDAGFAQPQQPPGVESGSGIAGIAGIAGVSSGKRKSLMEKFRALPKARQYLVIVLVIAFGYFFFLDDDEDAPAPQQKQHQVKKGGKSKKKDGSEVADKSSSRGTSRPFSALSKEKQDFVRTQHKLAFEYFSHQDYANALAAIKPIFEYVDDYEDSREIQRYAEDGIRQMKVIAEEKAKKEAEEAKARKITELLNRGRDLMGKKKYTEASSVFNDIIVIDPENAQVGQWQAKIREHEEELKIEAQKKQVQAEINSQAWGVYKEGVSLRRRGQLRKAISVLGKVKDFQAVDARPARMALEQIQAIHTEIQTQLEPLLQDAKGKEDSQDFAGAMEGYTKALDIEPESSEASQGFSRVKAILNDRAKALYTEAVLAESYSDFATAKKKFQQCSEMAPKDSLYRERAIRKLARYFKADEMTPSVPQ